MAVVGQYFSIALVFVSAVYTLLTVFAVRHFVRSSAAISASSNEFTPPVTILKPVSGLDAEAEKNFLSFIEQEYPVFQILFGALDSQDPAIEVARQLSAKFPERDIQVIANPRIIGENLKVSNLHNLVEHAKYDLLIIADSDMHVRRDYLRSIVAPFADARVGLVTSPYRGRLTEHASLSERIIGALHGIGITTDFMPSVFVAKMLGGMRFAFGSTIAIRRDALSRIGGFEAIRDHLADDYQLGARVHALGLTVVLSHYIVDNVLGPEPFLVMFGRRLRWARTIKISQRAGYLGSVVTYLIPLSLVMVVLWGGATPASAIFAAATGLRFATVFLNNRLLFHDEVIATYPWLLPVNDFLSFIIWCWSLLPGSIIWRGQRFRLTRDGRLISQRNDDEISAR